MKNKKKTIILVIGIVLLGLLVVGGTYAYLIKALDVTNGNYNISSACFDINYDTTNDDGTSDITGTLIPSATAQGGLSGEVSLGLDSACALDGVYASGTITLNVNNVDSTLTQIVRGHCENFKTLKTLTEYYNQEDCEASVNGVWVTDGTALKYAVYSNVNDDPINVGYIKETGSISIYNNFNVGSNQKVYHMYIWLDGNFVDDSYASLVFGGNISAEVIQRLDPLPEKPTLDDGMIPVVISADGVVKTISKNDENWYDYSNKEWANVVLVDDDSRGTYRGRTGVTVAQDDILAYYVWIPRYKYKIWTTTRSTKGREQTIEILFEDRENTMTLGTTIGSYRSHPAFWWDDDSDSVVDTGELLAGIWVGKFETSPDSSSSCYTDYLDCNNTYQSPRILPNVTPLMNQTVNNQFITSQKFSASGNIYGLSSISTNSHMMKNSEWGAVTYLSHSAYGINDEIRINNNSNPTTGCGALNVGGESTSSCEISYNATSTPQSTTGNITGIYDMSGGAMEYVMSNYDNTIGSSGFTTLPASKYYDLYTGTSGLDSCNGGICYGHAISEVSNWYSDWSSFVSSEDPWPGRGGGNSAGDISGAFYFLNYKGHANPNFSWRSVLVVGYGM